MHLCWQESLKILGIFTIAGLTYNFFRKLEGRKWATPQNICSFSKYKQIIETKFTYQNICPFKVCDSVISNIFSALYNHHHYPTFKYFHHLRKENSYPLSVTSYYLLPLAPATINHPFNGWRIFNCRHIPHIFYPFICSQTFGLFSFWGYHK